MTLPGSLLLAATAAAPSGPLPDASIVRQTAREVLARPEYRLDAPPDFSDAFTAFMNFVHRVVEVIQGWFDRLYDMSPLLAWGLTLALVISLVLLIGHITWTVMTAVRGDRRGLDVLAESTRRKVDPAELVREADDAGARGNYILGVRLLYRACLVRLEQAEEKPFRPGATNREHLNRYRATPLYDGLSRLVSIIDLKWYGDESCVASDFAESREAYERIAALARGRAHAHHA